MGSGLSSSPHLHWHCQRTVAGTCPAHTVQTQGTASDHEGMAWALATLHSWLIPLYGAAPLLLLPDRINLSMGYSGKSRNFSLQFFCSKTSAYKNEAGGSVPSMD